MEQKETHTFKNPDDLASWMFSLPSEFRGEKWCYRFLNYHKAINVGCGCQKKQRIKNRDVAYLDMVQSRIAPDKEVKQKIKTLLNANAVEFYWEGNPHTII